jgi:hypothetical protein
MLQHHPAPIVPCEHNLSSGGISTGASAQLVRDSSISQTFMKISCHDKDERLKSMKIIDFVTT